MKVIYHSALIHQELTRDSIFYAVPGKARLELIRERGDQHTDVLFNGSIVGDDLNSIEIGHEAELIVKYEQERAVYTVRPVCHPLTIEYASAYEQFQYEYNDLTEDEIKGICSGHLKMYAVEQSAEVRDWSDTFQMIEEAFSAFKTICDKPKSHLKAVNEVRPIETVKRVGYESISYLASHSEDWLARTASGLKPARLFSRVEDDEYQIYENRVVKTLIDLILAFLRKTEKELRDQSEQLRGIINSSVQTGSFGFDVSFQKAVAELLSSDDKDSEYRSKALDLAEKLHRQARRLLKKYRGLRQSRLYRYLKRAKAITNPLNETNILLMDKNYNVIFKLWKVVHDVIAPKQIEHEQAIETKYTYDDYSLFLRALCGYTAHVLGFELIENGHYYRSSDCLDLSIYQDRESELIHMSLSDKKKHELTVANGLQIPVAAGESFETFYYDGSTLSWDNAIDDDAIDRFCSLFKTRESRGKEQAEEKKRYSSLKQAIDQREREYPETGRSDVVICPAVVELENSTRNSFKDMAVKAAEMLDVGDHAQYVIVALPTCNEDEQKITEYAKRLGERVLLLPLTMFDINSFRRVQNVLLRQLMALDTGKCPNCGGDLRGEGNQRVCDNCNQLILTKTICPNPDCKHSYSYLSYDVSSDTLQRMQDVTPEFFFQFDSLYQYKDVVEMSVSSGKLRTRCPCCNQ